MKRRRIRSQNEDPSMTKELSYSRSEY